MANLRIRLLCLVLLAIVPALVLIVYTAAEQRREVIAETQETALRLARLASTDQARLIASARELLVTLARLREVRSKDSAACGALFKQLLTQYPLYANLVAADAAGDVFCSALPSVGRINVADRAYFRRAVQTGDFSVGDYQIGRITGQPTVNVAFPMREDGTLHAVVIAAISLNWLNDLVGQAGLPDGATLTVADSKGTILVRHPDGGQWVGKVVPEAAEVRVATALGMGIGEADAADGTPLLLGFSPLLNRSAGGDVFVSVGVPRSVVIASANSVLRRNLAALGVVGILALVAAWYGGDVFVVRRARRLVAATRRLAAGDLSARAGGPYTGELGELAHSFDEMADAIHERELEIKRSAEALRRQQEALFKNEKLADLGRLAAGVAHELRNPLTVIAARLQLLEKENSRGPVSPENLKRTIFSLEEAAERMRRIMDGLSSYSKPQRPEPTLLNVGELLSAVAQLVAYKTRSGNVTVTVEAVDTLPSVRGDRSQMMQILVNLVNNAIEAMAATGGTLLLRAAVKDGVVVDVVDNGPGIPEERFARIWEAFYTTKDEGTGLGLSIVKALVHEQPGAKIEVESRVGLGTTFRITMPAA